jgi:hypothetical protein
MRQHDFKDNLPQITDMKSIATAEPDFIPSEQQIDLLRWLY